MKEVWVNHKLVDFLNAIKQQKITPGCSLIEEEPQPALPALAALADDSEEYVKEHVMEDSEDDQVVVPSPDLCANNKCQHGSKCVPQPPYDYVCKCTPPWTGKFCDQGNVRVVILFSLNVHFMLLLRMTVTQVHFSIQFSLTRKLHLF